MNTFPFYLITWMKDCLRLSFNLHLFCKIILKKLLIIIFLLTSPFCPRKDSEWQIGQTLLKWKWTKATTSFKYSLAQHLYNWSLMKYSINFANYDDYKKLYFLLESCPCVEVHDSQFQTMCDEDCRNYTQFRKTVSIREAVHKQAWIDLLTPIDACL